MEIEKAIADIRNGLVKAEQRIEADARGRIRGLQKEGQAQLRALEAKRREASRLLDKLTTAAGESWDDIVKTAQTMVSEARTTALGVVERLPSVLSSAERTDSSARGQEVEPLPQPDGRSQARPGLLSPSRHYWKPNKDRSIGARDHINRRFAFEPPVFAVCAIG